MTAILMYCSHRKDIKLESGLQPPAPSPALVHREFRDRPGHLLTSLKEFQARHSGVAGSGASWGAREKDTHRDTP